MSFPKYGWFSVWVYGKLGSELGYGDGWDAYINNICQGEQIEGFRLFYELYEEFSRSQPICYSQKLDAKKKIFADAPRGPFWPRLNDTTTELLMFELPPSRSAWCLFLSDDKIRLHTLAAESKPVLLQKIREHYFAVEEDEWIQFNGDPYLKNLILDVPKNNY